MSGIAEWDVLDEMALCVTVVERCLPEDAAHLIALDDFTSLPDLETASEWVDDVDTYDRSWFATGTVAGRTFLWEDNGWQGVTEDPALRLAAGGPLWSTSWNVNAVMHFLAVDGDAVVRWFDPLFHDSEHSWWRKGTALPGEDDLDWESSPQASALQLLSRAAGVPAVESSWLSLPGVRFWGHRF